MGIDCVGDALGAAYVNDAEGLTEPVARGLDAAERGVPDGRADAEVTRDAVGDAEALALAGPDVDAGGEGENIAGWVADGEDGEEVVQAATATATQTVKAAAPSAVFAVLTAPPTGAARTFMKPPTEWIL